MPVARTPRFPLLREVEDGETADVYFLRVRTILAETGRDPRVGMEIFPRTQGLMCGVNQVVQLLQDAGFAGELWSLTEGSEIAGGEAVMQLRDRYSGFGIYETAILGLLASGSGWATAARAVVDVAGGIPVVSFGARHVHPNVAGLMDYAAVVGGCVGCSTPLGAALSGIEPSGTMPHAYVLIVGDTVEAAFEFDRVMPDDVPRIVLVDTLRDEAIEAVRVAEALGPTLNGVRLDTPSERGGVTPELVREVRARLDLKGFQSVQITVSGGMDPARIRRFLDVNAPVDGFGVGSFISTATPIEFTGDIREIDGMPVAKRGRLPGMQHNERLRRLI
jgi:nicotinate phosphoribosyltransferase